MIGDRTSTVIVKGHVLVAADAAFFVAAAEEVGDVASMIGDVHVIIDIGTGITFTRAVTAAEEPLVAATFDDDVGGTLNAFTAGTYVSCIAAAINIFNGVVAVMDMHRGHLAIRSGRIMGFVATAKHFLDGIATVRVGHNVVAIMLGLVDMDGNIILRRAIDIVATKHRAVDNDIVRALAAVSDVHLHDALGDGDIRVVGVFRCCQRL